VLGHAQPALQRPSLHPSSTWCHRTRLCASIALQECVCQAHGTGQGAASHGARVHAWKQTTKAGMKAVVGRWLFTTEGLYFVAALRQQGKQAEECGFSAAELRHR